jgi:flagellar protein FliO/FliZ
MLWFIAILAMIPLALWLLKRTPMGGAGAHGVMRSVAVLPISPSQRIVTVEVGQGAERRWLVLGVTPQQISTLHTMAPQDDALAAPPQAVPPLPFAQLLSRLRQDKGGGGGR